MADPFHKVRPGEPLKIHANAWNKMLDVVGQRHAIGADSTADEKASNIVLVENVSVLDMPIFGVLAIDGASIPIDPSGGTMYGTDEASARAREFARRPVLRGGINLPSDASKTLVICLEPIQSGKIGRAAIAGCTPCKVHVTNVMHTHAGFRPGDHTQLLSSACGPVRLAWKEQTVGVNKWAVGVL